MLCAHGPTRTRFTPLRLRSAANASRSLCTKLSYHPPTENTGTRTLSNCSRVLMARQNSSNAGCSITSRYMGDAHPSAATSAERTGRCSTNWLRDPGVLNSVVEKGGEDEKC